MDFESSKRGVRKGWKGRGWGAWLAVALALAGAGWSGCATNPVTGKSELTLISEAQEIELGSQQYGPTQQSQGGAYVTLPEVNLYVREVGMKLARVSDRPDLPYEFVVLDNPEPNAWALPGGKIAVNRGLLLELENEAELAAVLAHEIVHAAARHSAQAVERQMLGNLAAQAVVVGTSELMKDRENRDLVVQATTTAAQLGTTLVYQTYSRGSESEADAYGMRYMAKAGYDPRAAVTLQEKFVRMAGGREADVFSRLFASHPPSQERVEANKRTLAQMSTGGGMTGEAEYAARVQRLRAAEPAYAAYGQAVEMAQANLGKALARVAEAKRLLPGEARFFALEASLQSRQGNLAAAGQAANRARELNPGFYQNHLLAGQIEEKRGQKAAAAKSYAASHALLPTDVSTGGLARLAPGG